MKKILVSLIVLILVFVAVFVFIKNKDKKTKEGNENVKIVRQNDPPFMFNFPTGLIPSVGIINVVDSFRVERKDSSLEQFTYKYVTSDTFSSIHPYFDQYFIKNGFRQGFLNSTDKSFSLNAQKDKVSVSIYAEKNTTGSGTTVEINVVK